MTETDVRRFAPSNNIVLPHIVSAVLSYPENRQLMGQIKEQMSQKAEEDPEVKKAYNLMMKYGPKQYPYALFMTRHAFLPMEVDEVNNLLDADRTVKLIHEAGGIAIMAHWYYNEHKLSEAGLRAMLKRDALDGLESVIINTIGEKDETEEVNRTRKLIEEFGVAETVGSDSHSAADLEAFAQSRYAAESQGQTARLVERFRPDLSWSNL
jgi:hypothetical protein